MLQGGAVRTRTRPRPWLTLFESALDTVSSYRTRIEGNDVVVGPPGVEPGYEPSESSISSMSGPACPRRDSNPHVLD